MSSKPHKWVALPPDFAVTVVDCTIDEAAAFRRCSRWEIFKKIRTGAITAFKECLMALQLTSWCSATLRSKVYSEVRKTRSIVP